MLFNESWASLQFLHIGELSIFLTCEPTCIWFFVHSVSMSSIKIFPTLEKNYCRRLRLVVMQQYTCGSIDGYSVYDTFFIGGREITLHLLHSNISWTYVLFFSFTQQKSSFPPQASWVVFYRRILAFSLWRLEVSEPSQWSVFRTFFHLKNGYGFSLRDSKPMPDIW